MIEFWDYLSQFLAVTAGFCAALRAYLKSREQPWFLLTCFYGTFALGTLYWTLHLLLRQETPQVFYVSDLAWLASYVFLLALTLTLLDAGERQSRTGLCWLAPVFCLPQFLLYVTRGDLLLNVRGVRCGASSGRKRRETGGCAGFTERCWPSQRWSTPCGRPPASG